MIRVRGAGSNMLIAEFRYSSFQFTLASQSSNRECPDPEFLHTLLQAPPVSWNSDVDQGFSFLWVAEQGQHQSQKVFDARYRLSTLSARFMRVRVSYSYSKVNCVILDAIQQRNSRILSFSLMVSRSSLRHFVKPNLKRRGGLLYPLR